MYRLNEEKVFYDIADGQAVVIDFTSGTYYDFSRLGSEVLDRLVQGAEADAVLRELRALPGCPENAEEALRGFLAVLTDHAVLLPADGAAAEPAPLPPEALEDGFDLEVNVHAEVQEILLADPVHDVDMDMGWPILKEDG